MIIKEQQLVETEGNFDSEDEIEIEVAKDEANKLFSILIENYKNARASMIREYVSNAWDAHKEIESDEPVIVKLDKDDGGWFLEIIDKGVGMTSKFVRKIFSKLLKSTKGDTNEQIGSFGIGSKSGLAYTNQFLLDTIKDGIKSSYLIFRETTGMPKILPTNEEKTDEHSGTTIKIYLKTEKQQHPRYSWRDIDEYELIAETCIKELTFFDNVVLKFDNHHISSSARDYNEGKIIEGNTFKYRTSCQYSDEMHLIIGKVAYSIDWKELSMSSINIPIGIKFEIGELMVNMTREMIRYSDESKKLIKERIESAINELVEKYNSFNQPIESLMDFVREKHRFEKERIHYLTFKNPNDNEELAKLNISTLSDRLNPLKLASIQHLPIKLQKGQNPYFFLDSNYELNNNYKKENKIRLTRLHYTSNTKLVFLDTNVNPDNKTKNKYINNCLFVRKNYYSFNKWCDILGLELVNTKIKNLDRKNSFDRSENYYQLGSAKIIYEYKKIITDELKRSFEWIDYANFEVPKEYLEEQKRLIKENKIAKEKLQGVISVKDINAHNPTGHLSRIIDLKLETLNNFTGFIVYGFRDDVEDLEKLRDVLFCKKQYTYTKYEEIRKEHSGWGNSHKTRIIRDIVTYLNDKICRIYCISKQNANVFLNKQQFKAYHISKMIEIPQIQRFLTTSLIQNNENCDLKQGEVKLFNERIGNLIKDVSEFYANNNSSNKLDVLKELVEKFNVNYKFELSINPIIKYKLDQINKYFEGVELIRYVKINDKSLPHIVKYLKEKKKPVNLNYYSEGKGIESSNIPSQAPILIEQEYQDLAKYWENYIKSSEIKLQEVT